MPPKKRTREEVLAWAAALVDPDEPSVLACATPRSADPCQTAAQLAVGKLAPSRVASLAKRFSRLVECEAAAGAKTRSTKPLK